MKFTFPIQFKPGAALAVAAAVLVITVATQSGCSRSESANPGVPPETNTKPALNTSPAEATVELAPGQLDAIKVEPVGTFLFPIELEAVGSVSFDEDPAVVQAESALLGAAATFDLTNKELARVKGLGEMNGVAQREMEQATSDNQTAVAALRAARDAVRALGKTDAEIGAMIATGKIEAAPARQRWVVANVPEGDSPRLRAGQIVQVNVAAFPDRAFGGKISRLYATVDTNTHRVMIRCAVKDPANELRPGMLADVVIRVQDPVEATAIPADGVVRESDGTMTAWVTSDRHRFVQKLIQVGLRKDGQVQILDGLQRGELAVTEGAVFLSNLLNAPPGD